MSVLFQNLRRSLPVFLSRPAACPYLPEAIERKLFIRLTGKKDSDVVINSLLTSAGFRRCHDIVYRPACPFCKACVPLRIPVEIFRPSRSMKRVMARNRDLLFEKAEAINVEECYDLFVSYQNARHPRGDMAAMSKEEFVRLISSESTGTVVYQLRKKHNPDREGQLMGAIIVDCVEDGLSAVYSFFCPDEAVRSLGVFLIISLVEEARMIELPFVYLGYWVSGARKMAYKSRFKPIEALGPDGWNIINAV